MSSMVTNLEEVLLGAVRSLPPDKRQELVDFANFLKHQAAANDQGPREDIAQVIASLRGGKRSKEDIDQQLAEERDWGEQ